MQTAAFSFFMYESACSRCTYYDKDDNNKGDKAKVDNTKV
jgi:hypothetical protein